MAKQKKKEMPKEIVSQEAPSALEGNAAPQKNEKTGNGGDNKTKRTEKPQQLQQSSRQPQQGSKKDTGSLPLIIGGLLLIVILLGGGLLVLMLNKPAPEVVPPLINKNATVNMSQNQTPVSQ